MTDTTYNEKWDAEKFTINARLKILTRLMLNRVNRRVNAINPAALIETIRLSCTAYEISPPLLYLATPLAFNAPGGGVPLGRSP